MKSFFDRLVDDLERLPVPAVARRYFLHVFAALGLFYYGITLGPAGTFINLCLINVFLINLARAYARRDHFPR